MKGKNVRFARDINEALHEVQAQLEALKQRYGAEWMTTLDTSGRAIATELFVAKANLMHALALLETDK